jgi:hypothetical protein
VSVDRSGALAARHPADHVPAATLPAEDSALLATWTTFWRSRLLIWGVGCLVVLLFGTVTSSVTHFDPLGISMSFGHLGNVLGAPAVRWDAIWYVQIAQHGYTLGPETRFFPLYPLLVRDVAWVTRSIPLAGVLVSVVAMIVALEVIRRLTALELGPSRARLTVELIAFGPLALFLSAVYTESLFLALSAGTFHAARRGRWPLAGALGALAALTRVTGVLLVVPLVLLFFYGPRADAAPEPRASRLRPRYRFTGSVLWVALVPCGTALFSAYLAVQDYRPLAFIHAQQLFSRHEFVLPIVGAARGLASGAHDLVALFGGGGTVDPHHQAIVGCAALIVSLVALVGVFRRLPPAYGAYVLVGLLVPLASPTIGDPLKGLARYASVLFPLYMWAAAWATDRGLRRPLLIASGLLLVFFTAQFAIWHVVGSALL